jgi:hypothetical protein
LPSRPKNSGRTDFLKPVRPAIARGLTPRRLVRVRNPIKKNVRPPPFCLILTKNKHLSDVLASKLRNYRKVFVPFAVKKSDLDKISIRC